MVRWWYKGKLMRVRNRGGHRTWHKWHGWPMNNLENNGVSTPPLKRNSQSANRGLLERMERESNSSGATARGSHLTICRKSPFNCISPVTWKSPVVNYKTSPGLQPMWKSISATRSLHRVDFGQLSGMSPRAVFLPI